MNEQTAMTSANEPKDMGDRTPMSPLRVNSDERRVQMDRLRLLRKPFPDNQISALPKPTARQTEELKKDFSLGSRCGVCGGWHQRDVVHLDYVGHAALTDRLLDADPEWSWEPLSLGQDGLPLFDAEGGLWIRLTVCGLTRIGYGDSQGKKGPNAIKECIGDALRNAAMRFGAALDLWHKGELHEKPKCADDESEAEELLSDEQQATISDMLEATASNVKAFCGIFRVQRVCDIPAHEYARALDLLKKKEAKGKVAKVAE